jgi:hypothetical protein
MKAQLIKILSVFLVLCVWGTAVADSTVRVVWICSVNDGKTMDDVRTSNSAWVRFMHANVDDAISSTILTPVVGNIEAGRFIFADDFPSYDVWNEAREASETDEGQAIDAAINEAATCDSNSLHSAEVS